MAISATSWPRPIADRKSRCSACSPAKAARTPWSASSAGRSRTASSLAMAFGLATATSTSAVTTTVRSRSTRWIAEKPWPSEAAATVAKGTAVPSAARMRSDSTSESERRCSLG